MVAAAAMEEAAWVAAGAATGAMAAAEVMAAVAREGAGAAAVAMVAAKAAEEAMVVPQGHLEAAHLAVRGVWGALVAGLALEAMGAGRGS